MYCQPLRQQCYELPKGDVLQVLAMRSEFLKYWIINWFEFSHVFFVITVWVEIASRQLQSIVLCYNKNRYYSDIASNHQVTLSSHLFFAVSLHMKNYPLHGCSARDRKCRDIESIWQKNVVKNRAILKRIEPNFFIIPWILLSRDS